MNKDYNIFRKCVHEAGHALVAYHFSHFKRAKEIVIDEDDSFIRFIDYDPHGEDAKAAIESIKIYYGGMAAEEIVFTKSQGYEDDMKMINRLTMLHILHKDGEEWFIEYGVEEKYQNDKNLKKAAKLGEKCFNSAKKYLAKHQDILLKLANTLYDKRYLNMDGIDDIIIGSKYNY